MIENILKIKEEFNSEELSDLNSLENIRILYLGKKGKVNDVMALMKSLSKDEIRESGKSINDLKVYITDTINEKKSELEAIKLNEKLNGESIDVTLGSMSNVMGVCNPIERVIESLESVFIGMGYTVVEGPEIESDLYNFELLNLPIGHPARDEQDTFYITPSLLLRSQTSPVQVRTMLANEKKSPIRVVCPGKTYRRDNDDASHSHQFTQMEGLLIDEKISLADLKGTMDIVVKSLFGEVESRFRPSFYPFTEPSVELDISCFKCGKKGCDLCKGTGFITVGGAGMVHPNVLTNCGYDTDKYNGFAFGFGIDRLTMLKYGISDIRVLYTNDIRVLKQFDRSEDNEN